MIWLTLLLIGIYMIVVAAAFKPADNKVVMIFTLPMFLFGVIVSLYGLHLQGILELNL